MAESIFNLGTFRWLCFYTGDLAQISEIKVKASPFQTSSITIGQEQGGKPKQPQCCTELKGRSSGAITWFRALYLCPRPSNSLFAPYRIF